MKEPTIGRDLYDDLQIRFDDLQAKYHDLVEEMLKRNPPPPAHVDVSYSDEDNFPVPDAVMAAILVYSDPGSVDADTAQEVAFGMLRGELSEEDVVAAIHAGEEVDS